MPGVNEGLQGRVAQPCELRESQMLVSQPSLTATPGDTCSTPNSFKMLEQLVEQLRCELALASSFREETQAQLTMIFNRQLEVLMRLERLDPTHRASSGNDPVFTGQPFPLQSEQRPPSERVNEVSASFARDVHSTVRVPLPESIAADHEHGVIDETRDELRSITSTGTKKSGIINANSPPREDTECRRQRSSRTKQPRTLRTIKDVTRSLYFKRFFACLVLANITNLGIVASEDLNMAAQGTVRQHSWLDDGIHLAFLIAFSVELGCNVYAEGKGICWSHNRRAYFLDFILVTFDLVDFLLYHAGETFIKLPNISALRIFRMFKAARLVRMLKALQYARELRLMVLAITSSMHSLVCAMFLLVCIIYSFAILIASWITVEILEEHFYSNSGLIEWWGSLSRVSLTLFQSISGGANWIDPFKALQGSPSLQGAFIVYLSFVLFALLNVVTGVFCNTAIEMASRDTDMIIAAQMEWDSIIEKDLHKIFHRMTGEESDRLTLDGWVTSMTDPWITAFLSHLEIEVHHVTSFFSVLDEDNDNGISLSEFTEGCKKYKGHARTLDTNLMLMEQHKIIKQLNITVLEIHKTLGRCYGTDGVATERGPCDVELI
eukprot:TRINITY_DN6022_c0_g3_i1.p1 TRINITY_DN6022_c0_g3~~TRINITY_DN6022_c0_g3_i1.p1  ORF type:complete len:666 (+),score=70.41 TRINITY_DN6022_c0_g3_i1:175-1998(+)